MVYNERFKDKDFLKVLSKKARMDTNEVANEVGCSYEEVKQRLRRLEESGEVISDKEAKKQRTLNVDPTYKIYWKLNPDYVPVIWNPETIGIHFYDRGVVYQRDRFIKFANACKTIVDNSGLSALNSFIGVFNADTVKIGDSRDGLISLEIDRVIGSSPNTLLPIENGRYTEDVMIRTVEYNVVVCACLIALRHYFPRTKLSLGVNDAELSDALRMASTAINNTKRKELIEKKKLINEMEALDRNKLMRVFNKKQMEEIKRGVSAL